MVLDLCPDIADYARGRIANWNDLVATAVLVCSILGVSPSAWAEAVEVMGERKAATVVAAILQRADAISNAGGYLRDLTRKAQAGQFSVGPMLRALFGRRKTDRKRA
jgi:replication initiation protein RepC